MKILLYNEKTVFIYPRRGIDYCMISDADHFVLLKTIKAIKDRTDKVYTLGNDDLQNMRDEFLVYLQQLVAVVNKLHKEEKNV
jgi:hypothetical protein